MLTSEIFGLEVTATGFHRLLANAALRMGTYEGVLDHFDNQLGAEARALVRAMLAEQVNR